MTRATSTECLLPLPATKEWGEGRGEGRPCKHCTKTTLTVSTHPSPWPSPRFAGRGYSRRSVAYPTVFSVTQAERCAAWRRSRDAATEHQTSGRTWLLLGFDHARSYPVRLSPV